MIVNKAEKITIILLTFLSCAMSLTEANILFFAIWAVDVISCLPLSFY